MSSICQKFKKLVEAEDTLRFDRDPNRESLVVLAPILYRGALLAFLMGKVPGGPDEPYPDSFDVEAVAKVVYERGRGLSNVQSGLAVALRANDREDPGDAGETDGG